MAGIHLTHWTREAAASSGSSGRSMALPLGSALSHVDGGER
jgi:hypothetical protein